MSFHSINWLYAGVAVLAITLLVYVRGESARRKLLAQFASAKLLPELSRTVSPAKVFAKKLLFALGLFAVFVALARPQWGYRWEETKSRGIDVIFAIDTSKSMLAEDVKPNRLDRAKLSVLDLLDSIGGDRIGIVAFSGQAFLQCPLTLDYDAFRMSLEALDTNVIQRGGTNIAAAITEADSAFAESSNHKVIVLISDGEELESSAVERAKKAASDGVVIYTLGVGGTRGEAITVRDSSGRAVQLRDEDGKIVTSKLNEKVLTEVAKATGGFYEPLTANGMDAIYENGLKKIPQQELSARMKQLAIERFQIPLAIAMVLLALESLVGTRRFFAGGKSAHTAVLTLFLLPVFFAGTPDANAQDAAEKPAEVAENAQSVSENSPSEKPASEKPGVVENPTARDVFNNAVDLYQKGELSEAKDGFVRAMKMSPDDFDLHAKAFYNIGNIDYRQAKYSLASAESSAESGAKAAQLDKAFADTAVAGNVLLQQGAPLLEKELAAIAAAKTEDEKKAAMEKSPLKDKQFQQQLKQGISQCDAVEKQTAELSKAAEKNLSQWKSADDMLAASADDYKSALALAGEFPNAVKNSESVKTARKNVAEELSKSEKLQALLSSDETKQKLAAIAKLKEELKKLVRDDNNQQNQNQQQQQQQQQQQNQNQQQQNQQNQQNQQQQNQQNQNQQQNQNDQQQQNNQNSRDNQQQKDNQNKQDNSKQNDKQDKQDRQNSQDKREQSKPDSDKNGGKDKQDKSQNADANRDKSEPNRDEQAVDNSRQKPADEGERKPENAQKHGGADDKKELPAQPEKAKGAAQASEEKASENERENFRASAGTMTKGEAKQLLESMKDSDKILPLRGFGEQKDRFEKSYKDW